MPPPVLYVDRHGVARPYVLLTERVQVGPVLSRVGGLLYLTAHLDLHAIKALRQERRQYNQPQIGTCE